MSTMDADTRAILDSIISTSENPLMDIMANMCGGKSSGRISISTKRERSNSDSSERGPAFRQFMESVVSDSNQPEASSSSNSKDKGAEEMETEKEPESLVEQVKRQRLDEYERTFLESIVDTDKIDNSFESVYLPEETIDTLRSLVSLPLMCPEEFKFGILKQHTMSGALLFGPPGTGKTLFAQALAKESGANMISVKPSDILDKCVGESEKLVRGLFKLARRLHPCVIFIDELDALFGARTHAGQQSSARWHTSMLTEFMQEMDGLMASKVVVIGATNRPFDLDDAVLRRLPCRMLIDLPDKPAREAILKILLREEALAEDVKLESLAGMTDRYSGSDLKNLCVAAAVNAVKDNISVPWKTGTKKGKERAPGQSTYTRPKPPTSITPMPETAGASIVEVPGFATSVTSPGGTTMNSPSTTLKPTPTSTKASTEASSPSSPVDPEPARNKSPFVTTRVLANSHFSHALTQVGPSSSDDQSTLGEIRAWNAKYGSGANKTTGILGGSYAGRPGVPPFNPSSAGAGIPGYGARTGGSSLFGSSGIGSGIPGVGSSSGTGVPGYGGAGVGTAISGYPSSTGTSIPGITGPGTGMGVPRFDQAGAGGSSMGYIGLGGSGAGMGTGAGAGIPGYSGPGSSLNFGTSALGGGRDMSWLQGSGASSSLGLGSDDMDFSKVAAAARQMGAGSGAGISSESALGKAVGV